MDYVLREDIPRISSQAKCEGSVDSEGCAEDISGVGEDLALATVLVEVVDPLVGRFPDDGPYPKCQVGCDKVHEAEASKEAEPLDDHLKLNNDK